MSFHRQVRKNLWATQQSIILTWRQGGASETFVRMAVPQGCFVLVSAFLDALGRGTVSQVLDTRVHRFGTQAEADRYQGLVTRLILGVEALLAELASDVQVEEPARRTDTDGEWLDETE